MSWSEHNPRRWQWTLGLVGLYLAVGMWPIAVGVVRPGITGYKRAMLEDMVYGQAYRPFVKRHLVSLVVRGTTWLTPESTKDRLRNAFARSDLIRRLGWPPAYAPEFVATIFIMYLSLIGFLIALRHLLESCLVLPVGWAHASALIVGVGLPCTFAGQVYPYDFPQLLLFTLALWCLVHERWKLFYPVYVLSCLNKETTVLIPLVFAFWKGKAFLVGERRVHLIVQVLVGACVCLSLSWVFRANPGGTVEWHLSRNIALSFSPLGWVRVSVLALGLALAMWRIGSAPPFLSRGFVATVPTLLFSAFFFGYLDETRGYYEALPFIVGLSLLTIGWPFGVRPRLAPGE